jgi:hydrogenase-4 component E
VSAYLQLPFIEQAILTVAALVLLTAFALLAQSRVVATIHMFAWQGLLLASGCALVAWSAGEPHLYFSALLTLLLKSLFIPWLLVRQARRLGILKDFDATIRPGLTLLAGGALVIFCYAVAQPLGDYAEGVTRHAIALSLAVVMLSMLMLVTRRKAITQVIAFMALENGMFFAGITATRGMPMIVELGVAFDVLVAAIIFGIFFFHIRDSIDSLDVDQLNRLTESEP